jgi:hypothetical protein
MQNYYYYHIPDFFPTLFNQRIEKGYSLQTSQWGKETGLHLVKLRYEKRWALKGERLNSLWEKCLEGGP